MNKTLLVIAPGNEVIHDAIFYLFVADTGECLASHLCSSYCFAKSDLYERIPERIEEFTKRFGECEVKFINETSITKDELMERNNIWYNNIHK